ncbi:MAG: peptide/nickel transport system substrate-binding protein [Solirubrobacteraceae bacterium]
MKACCTNRARTRADEPPSVVSPSVAARGQGLAGRLRAAWNQKGLLASAAAAVALGVAGCGGGGATADGSGTGGKSTSGTPATGSADGSVENAPVGEVLNLAMPGGPTSLDPAQFSSALEWFFDLPYDTLVVWGRDGKPHPGLATSWGYVGKGNRTFDVKLRPGVKFSDGTPLTAERVKASIEYIAKNNAGAAGRWTNKTIRVTGPLSLRITSKTPDPMIDREIGQNLAGAQIINAKALQRPKQLGTTTAGAGPYVLEPSETVANDHYTYTPNPHYWNKSAIHYKKVVVKVIPNVNSVLNAIKTGQVDAAPADYTVAPAAQSAGLQVKYTLLNFMGLNLMDRDGKMVPALGDVRVRQALNYAVDRETITRALFGDFAKPTEQTVVPGQDGAFDGKVYSYDAAKAKQLLADAGYANGFTLPVLTSPYLGQSQITQAIAGDLEKIGVKLKFKTISDTAQFFTEGQSGKYPAAAIAFGGLPIYTEGPLLFLPRKSGAVFNPLQSSDPELAALYNRAAAAEPAERAKLDQQIERRVVEQAWFLPVTLAPKFYFARSSVKGLEPTSAQPLPSPVWLYPAT